MLKLSKQRLAAGHIAGSLVTAGVHSAAASWSSVARAGLFHGIVTEFQALVTTGLGRIPVAGGAGSQRPTACSLTATRV